MMLVRIALDRQVGLTIELLNLFMHQSDYTAVAMGEAVYNFSTLFLSYCIVMNKEQSKN
jgi:hypothetical protein